jgi:hypothetical protein
VSIDPETKTVANSQDSLVEGEDYYFAGEAIVFTASYHLRRGYCCENNCRHCPYGVAAAKASQAGNDRKKMTK